MSRKWVCVNDQLNNCYRKDSQNINKSNSTCYLETFNTLCKWEPVFIITSENILHSFIARAISIQSSSQCKSMSKFRTIGGWGSINQNHIKSKCFFWKGLYFIECLYVMTLSNLLKCWLCDNVNLVLLWILRVLGARRQCVTVFSKKNFE